MYSTTERRKSCPSFLPLSDTEKPVIRTYKVEGQSHFLILLGKILYQKYGISSILRTHLTVVDMGVFLAQEEDTSRYILTFEIAHLPIYKSIITEIEQMIEAIER